MTRRPSSGLLVLLMMPTALLAQPQQSGRQTPDSVHYASLHSFQKLWNASKQLTARLTLDRQTYLPNEIASFRLELQNETAKPIEVFEPQPQGALGGLNLYEKQAGQWAGMYGHPFPSTFEDVREFSLIAARSGKVRRMAPGERMIFEGPLFGAECRQRQKQRQATLSSCDVIWETGKYAFRYDSAMSSNFAEFTIESASLAAIAVIAKGTTPDAEAKFKKPVFQDGVAYIVLRGSDGSNVVGVGEIVRHARWDAYSLDPDRNVADRDRFAHFPLFTRIASTREPLDDIDLSLAQNGEVTILLKSKTGKRLSIRLDAHRKVLDLPKEFEPK